VASGIRPSVPPCTAGINFDGANLAIILLLCPKGLIFF
jgi:hypothetical protein